MIIWIMIGLFGIMSIMFLCGKGASLIAGYNTASEQEKGEYDEVKLCRVVGVGSLVITLSLLVSVLFEDIAPYATIVGIAVSLIIMLVGKWKYAKKDEYDFIPKEKSVKKVWYKNSKNFSLLFTAIVLVIVGFMMFTGNVKIELKDNEIIASASMTSSTSIRYEDIQKVEYKQDIDLGSRTWGVGSAKLVAGHFKNEDYGKYNLYAYTNCKRYVVITTDNGYVVINDEDEEKTLKLYQQIQELVKKKGTI